MEMASGESDDLHKDTQQNNVRLRTKTLHRSNSLIFIVHYKHRDTKTFSIFSSQSSRDGLRNRHLQLALKTMIGFVKQHTQIPQSLLVNKQPQSLYS
jgi:hypothetical protein